MADREGRNQESGERIGAETGTMNHADPDFRNIPHRIQLDIYDDRLLDSPSFGLSFSACTLPCFLPPVDQ